MTEQPHRIPPKPFNAPPKGLWRATPPAIFPPILGALATGLAWRNASDVLGAPAWIGEMLLGALSLLYLFALTTYLAKVARRVGVVAEDLRILPGRTGLAAGSVAGMVLATILAPLNAALAQGVLIVALAAHGVIIVLIIRSFVIGPSEQARVTPAWHLSFVGPIVGAMAAAHLGWMSLATWLYATTVPIAAAIWLISILQFVKADVPAPLRPLLAIHLAPMALFTITSVQLGYEGAAVGFAILAITLFGALLVGARYLTKGGFSALWGAFTFPMAAFANAMLAVSTVSHAGFGVLGGIELVGATLAIAYIAYKIMTLWAKGKLAKATNASTV